MTEHRYPSSALRADYARAAAGLALTGGPLILVASHPIALWALGCMAGLFALFGVRTAARQTARFEVTEDAIIRTGISTFAFAAAKLRWSRLTKVRLRYYSTRRGKGHGWMQLILTTSDETLRIESFLDGFESVAARAADAARERRLQLDPTTISNFAALGIRIPVDDDGQDGLGTQ